jgi:ankyrin repeat protein
MGNSQPQQAPAIKDQNDEFLQQLLPAFQAVDSAAALKVIREFKSPINRAAKFKGYITFESIATVLQVNDKGANPVTTHAELNAFAFMDLIFENLGIDHHNMDYCSRYWKDARDDPVYADFPQRYRNYAKGCEVNVNRMSPVWLAYLLSVLDCFYNTTFYAYQAVYKHKFNGHEWRRVFAELAEILTCDLNDKIFGIPAYKLLTSTQHTYCGSNAVVNIHALDTQRYMGTLYRRQYTRTEDAKASLDYKNVLHFNLRELGFSNDMFREDLKKIIARAETPIPEPYEFISYLLRTKQYDLIEAFMKSKLIPCLKDANYLFLLEENYHPHKDRIVGLVKLFINCGVSITHKNSNGQYCFEVALANGHTLSFQYYLNNYDLVTMTGNKYTEAKKTILFMERVIAVFGDNAEIIDKMLEHKQVKACVPTAYGSNHVTLVRHFVTKYGPDCLKKQNSDGNNLMHIAADMYEDNLTEVLCILEEHKVEAKELLEVKNNNSHTPLQVAASWATTTKQFDNMSRHAFVAGILTKLLELGANTNVQDGSGMTVLHTIAKGKYISDAVIAVVITIIAGSAPNMVNNGDKDGNTALHYVACAESSDRIKLAQALIECGANKKALNKNMHTPENMAFQNKAFEMATLVA